MMRRTAVVLALFFGVAVVAPVAQDPARAPSVGCRDGTQAATNKPEGPHAYFQTLAARSECVFAYSLRDQAQLDKYRQMAKRQQYVVYDPAGDKDPRRQDAARLVIPADTPSLPNQIRLPLHTVDGSVTLVTWDAWFGSEFRHDNTGIGSYKTFQLTSPNNRIWFEVRTRFRGDDPKAARQERAARRNRRGEAGGAARNQKARGSRPATPPPVTAPAAPASAGKADHRGELIGEVEARGYPALGTALGPNVTKPAPLSPQVGTFAIRAETWMRFWVQIEQRANDWDLVSLWVADENHGPVQIIDALQFNVKGSVDSFWLEYNTSSNRRQDVGMRVAYVRNVAILRNVRDVQSILQRPMR